MEEQEKKVEQEKTSDEMAKEFYDALVDFRAWRESHGGMMYSPYDRARQHNEWAKEYYARKGIPYTPRPVEEVARSMQSPMEIMLREKYKTKDNFCKRLIRRFKKN